MDKYPVLISAIIQILLVVLTVWVNFQPVQKSDVTDEGEIDLSSSQAEGEARFYEEEEMDLWADVPEQAVALYKESANLGPEEAFEKLKQAHEIAPDWAHPILMLAVHHLFQGDFHDALKYFELTIQVQPRGCSECQIAIWSLKREMEGVFPQGLYVAYKHIWRRETKEEKIQMAKSIVDRFPGYAPAWGVLAENQPTSYERMLAIEKGLSADPDPQTKGSLIINKALVLKKQGKTEQAMEILRTLLFDVETTSDNFMEAEIELSYLEKRKPCPIVYGL